MLRPNIPCYNRKRVLGQVLASSAATGTKCLYSLGDDVG